MFYIDLIRISIPGIILGAIIGKLLIERPYYLRSLKPKFWISSAKKARRDRWIRVLSLSLIFGIITYFVEIEVGTILINSFGPLLAKENIFIEIATFSLPLLLISVTLLPILEEWIFRGVILEEISRVSNSKLIGLVSSSFFFAIFHLSNPGTYPIAAITYFVGGMLIGGSYLAGGLAVAVLSHIIYNLIPFLFIF